MKLPLSWLREFISIPHLAVEIAQLLTSVGIEVEKIHRAGANFEGVVVGEIIETKPHLDAEKLTLATVSDGREYFLVVCGASNCKKGLKTAFAKIGAILKDEKGNSFKIKKSKLRGVESLGMLCSESELGLSESHDGILELPEDAPVGIPLEEIFQDSVFEISLTPNLIHCQSVLGIARELSALTGIPVNVPKVSIQEKSGSKIDSFVTVSVKDQELCPRYACRLIRGIKVGPSPKWLISKLEAAGFRSVNNVVDCTNAILMELGHPLHAFDYDKVGGAKIIVELAKDGSKFETLDHTQRILASHMLMICDEAKPLAIAGVMGGASSEVSDSTVNVLIESAYFNPSCVRKTSKTLGLSSEGSKHFERGADPNQVIPSLDRVTSLIQELAGGEIIEGIIDIKTREFKPKTITLRLRKLNAILGTTLSLGEVDTILKKLECKISYEGQESLHVQVPTYRGDIHGEIDLVEEVARIYGYNHIPKAVMRYPSSPLPHASVFLFEREVRSRLIAQGLQEFLTCDLISPSLSTLLHNDAISKESIISVLNPTSIEQSVLRLSLLPGLLSVVKNNQDHSRDELFGFEVGRVHFKHEGLFKEHTNVGIILCGDSSTPFWKEAPKEVDFFDLKGIIENFCDSLYLEKPFFTPSSVNTLHPKRQAKISIDDRSVGSLGEIHPSILRTLGITKRVFFAEIDLHDLFKTTRREAKMKPLPLFPSTMRDWTITVNEEIPIQVLFDFVATLSSSILQELTLKTIYRNERLGGKKKNVTLNFVYRDQNRTLSFEEVEKEHERIVQGTIEMLNDL